MSPEQVEAALSRLTVHFSEGRGNAATWRLGVDVEHRVTETAWHHEHDAALLVALRGLDALGGLPHGLAARSPAAWEAAASALRAVKAGIIASGIKAERGKRHTCSPGTDSAGCKQVRRGARFNSYAASQHSRALFPTRAFRRRSRAATAAAPLPMCLPLSLRRLAGARACAREFCQNLV